MAETLPFVTLEPVNEYAKLAFSDAYDALISSRQDDSPLGLQHMAVETETRYCRDVMLFKRGLQIQKEDDQEDGDVSDTPAEPDTEEESDLRHLGMIWTGRYTLRLSHPPKDRGAGWVMGLLSDTCALVLCTKAFAKTHNMRVKLSHARLNFDLQNRALFIASRSSKSLTRISVNGTILLDGQIHALNHYSMTISIGPMVYTLRYTNHASTAAFLTERETYMREQMRLNTPVIFDMPTPCVSTKTVGQWTLSKPLGKGSSGKVFLGTNARNEAAAIKTIESNPRTSRSVAREIQVTRIITELVKEHDMSDRIVHMRELIHPGTQRDALSYGFVDYGLVLEPMAPKTLIDVLDEAEKKHTGPVGGMTNEHAILFRDALEGIKFLHDQGYIHRDIKPANIGVRAGRAIILDIGQAVELPSTAELRDAPGASGTMNYLAPEREMGSYGKPVDVWALGCIGFSLTYGYHPFRFGLNPWRPGDEYEAKRERWFIFYNHAIEKLTKDAEEPEEANPAGRQNNYVRLGKIVAAMLRHEYAQTPEQRAERVTATEALEDASWGSEEDRQQKRARPE